MLIDKIIKLLKDYDIRDFKTSFKDEAEAKALIYSELISPGYKANITDYIETIAEDAPELKNRCIRLLNEIKKEF